MFVKAGTPLTCENGHRIATAADDIRSGDRMSVQCFRDWTIAPPQACSPIRYCPICKGQYVRLKKVKVPERYVRPWKFWQWFTRPTEEVAYLVSLGSYEMHTPEGWQ